jgi:hypothetical protein
VLGGRGSPCLFGNQWCVKRSSTAVVILASPNTCGQSAKARLVVISSDVFSPHAVLTHVGQAHRLDPVFETLGHRVTTSRPGSSPSVPPDDPGMCPCPQHRQASAPAASDSANPGSPDPVDAEVHAEIGPPSAIAQNEFSARLRPPCAEASGVQSSESRRDCEPNSVGARCRKDRLPEAERAVAMASSGAISDPRRLMSMSNSPHCWRPQAGSVLRQDNPATENRLVRVSGIDGRNRRRNPA